MSKYRPTLAEFARYWEPSGDDPLTLLLTGAYLATFSILSVV